MIQDNSGFDVVKFEANLITSKPTLEAFNESLKITVNEFVYCNKDTLDCIEGFLEFLDDGIITEYRIFKGEGAVFFKINER